jgi:hypothetical protein
LKIDFVLLFLSIGTGALSLPFRLFGDAFDIGILPSTDQRRKERTENRKKIHGNRDFVSLIEDYRGTN